MKLLFISHIAQDQLDLVRLCKSQKDFALSLALSMEQAKKDFVFDDFKAILIEASMPSLDLTKLSTETIRKIVFYGNKNSLFQLKASKEYIIRFIEKPISPTALQHLMPSCIEPPAEKVAEQCLDFSYIEKLTRGKVELKVDLMEIFLDVVGEETLKVERALPKKDWVQISSSMHRMKSNLRMFGFMDIVEVVSDIETHTRNSMDIENCQVAILDVMPQLKRLLRCVEGERAKLN